MGGIVGLSGTCEDEDMNDYLGALFATLGASLSLNGDGGSVRGWAVSVGIGLVAGVSTMLGQWAVLAINRVRGLRMAMTLLTSAAGMLLKGAIQSALFILLGNLFLGVDLSLSQVLPLVLASYGPFWFGFLVVLPYTGPGIARILNVWVLLAMWSFAIVSLGLTRPNALLLTLGAWLGAQLIDWCFELAPIRLATRVFRWVSGSEGVTSDDLMRAAEDRRV